MCGQVFQGVKVGRWKQVVGWSVHSDTYKTRCVLEVLQGATGVMYTVELTSPGVWSGISRCESGQVAALP